MRSGRGCMPDLIWEVASQLLQRHALSPDASMVLHQLPAILPLRSGCHTARRARLQQGQGGRSPSPCQAEAAGPNHWPCLQPARCAHSAAAPPCPQGTASVGAPPRRHQCQRVCLRCGTSQESNGGHSRAGRGELRLLGRCAQAGFAMFYREGGLGTRTELPCGATCARSWRAASLPSRAMVPLHRPHARPLPASRSAGREGYNTLLNTDLALEQVSVGLLALACVQRAAAGSVGPAAHPSCSCPRMMQCPAAVCLHVGCRPTWRASCAWRLPTRRSWALRGSCCWSPSRRCQGLHLGMQAAPARALLVSHGTRRSVALGRSSQLGHAAAGGPRCAAGSRAARP